MTNSVISFPGFDPTQASTYIPTFGNWCGPNWSAGQRNIQLTATDMAKYPVAITPGPDGTLRPSPVDALCKNHDMQYAAADADPQNTASLVLQADVQLLQGVAGLNWSSLSTTEKTYSALMATAFGEKIQYVDIPPVAAQMVTELVNQIITSAGSAAYQPYIDSSGNRMSLSKDSSGNFVLNGIQDGNSESVDNTPTGEVANLIGYSSPGTIGYSETDDLTNGKVLHITIAGTNDTKNQSNANVAINNNSNAVLNGNNDTVNLGTGSNVNVTGNSDAVTLASGSQANLSGLYNSANLASNDSIVVSGIGASVNASGPGDTINIGGNGAGTTIFPTVDNVNLAQGGNVIETANSNVRFTGNGIQLSLGANDVAQISGISESLYVTGTNTTVYIGGDGQNAVGGNIDTIVAGVGDVVVEADNSNVIVSGNSVSVDLGNNDTVGINGSGDTIIGNAENLYFAPGVHDTVSGNDHIFGQANDVITVEVGNGNYDVESWSGSGQETTVDYNSSGVQIGTGNPFQSPPSFDPGNTIDPSNPGNPYDPGDPEPTDPGDDSNDNASSVSYPNKKSPALGQSTTQVVTNTNLNQLVSAMGSFSPTFAPQTSISNLPAPVNTNVFLTAVH